MGYLIADRDLMTVINAIISELPGKTVLDDLETNYNAMKVAEVYISGLTTAAEVVAYDVVNDPSWA